MNRKWVDNEIYFGPDRRRAPGRTKLLGERRQLNDADAPPPLGALLRRLRVMMVTFAEQDRPRALQFAHLAIGQARALGKPRCAAVLGEAARLIAEGDARGADEALLKAQTLA